MVGQFLGPLPYLSWQAFFTTLHLAQLISIFLTPMMQLASLLLKINLYFHIL